MIISFYVYVQIVILPHIILLLDKITFDMFKNYIYL